MRIKFDIKTNDRTPFNFGRPVRMSRRPTTTPLRTRIGPLGRMQHAISNITVEATV
jgi:hypothetical protein